MTATQCRYSVSDGEIVCDRPKAFFNRPLYCHNRPSVVVAGEMPELLLVEHAFCFGRLKLSLAGNRPARLVQTRFAASHVEYHWKDGRFGGLTVRVYPTGGGTGCWITASSSLSGSVELRLDWSDICVSTKYKVSMNWCDAQANPRLLTGDLGKTEPRAFSRSLGRGVARAKLTHPAYHTIAMPTTKGRIPKIAPVDDPMTIILKYQRGDARAARGGRRVAGVRVALSPEQPEAAFWWGREEDEPESWERARTDLELQHHRTRAVSLRTPSAVLDAAVPHVVAAEEGHYYPPFFIHGAMVWNEPYLGWNVYYGGIALGWSERLRRFFRLAFAAQETKPATDPYQRSDDLTMPGKQSHFYGRGYVALNQHMYNMQELFFEQVIEAHAHRLLGNLWPKARHALAEHVAWEKRCFDPDGDGLYENSINTWASDSVWYSGGAGAIATAMMYRAHLALGRRREAQRIRDAANEKLWIASKGWYAEYRDFDSGSGRRLHESACLYSVFTPITCGLADAFQAWQLLQYARHELEQVEFKNHPGRLCWLSQWVPYDWSVRELGHGETLTLALAAFMAGRADLGWDYLQGVIYHSQYDSTVPGAIAIESWLLKRAQAGTDFADGVPLYLRVISQGLAGYRPEPNGPLRWAPTFPPDWDHARLDFPDHGINFSSRPGEQEWTFRQPDGVPVEVLLPVPGHREIEVLVNGKHHLFEMADAVGEPRLRLTLRAAPVHSIIVRANGGRTARFTPMARAMRPGSRFTFKAMGGVRILNVFDPQGVFENTRRATRVFSGRVIGEPGHRMVFVKLMQSECVWWQPIEVWVSNPKPAVSYVPTKSRGRGSVIRPHLLENAFNGELKNICAKACISPRPKTCGAQIGIDGFIPWTYSYWKSGPPEFDATIWHAGGKYLLVDGVPFAKPQSDKDAIFVSHWDHLRRSVTVPLDARLKDLFVLMTLNTNVMQSHMEVLRVTVETDSGEHRFPLVHPRDVWSGLRVYENQFDRSCLPAVLPRRARLGKNLWGFVLRLSLPRGRQKVQRLTWECQAPETVGALLGISYR